MLKSMIDSMQGDISGVSGPQAQLVEFGEKINSSQKALYTIQKVHQTMCGKQTATTASQESTPNGSLSPPDSSFPSNGGSITGSISNGIGSPSGTSNQTGSPGTKEPVKRRASIIPPNADKYYVVVDPVDSCVGIEIEPSTSYLTLGNKSGYTTLSAAKKAMETTKAVCKRTIE